MDWIGSLGLDERPPSVPAIPPVLPFPADCYSVP
jgi:hypothetical protein